MTIFDSFLEYTLSGLGCLDINIVRFFIQAALFALCPAIVCLIAYVRNIRIFGLQVSLCVLAWLAAICVPVNRIEIYNSMARLWIMVVSWLVIIFVPPFLGFLLAPNPYKSRIITNCFYAAIALLAFLQLSKGGI